MAKKSSFNTSAHRQLIALAKSNTGKTSGSISRLSVELQRKTTYLTKKDVAAWRKAWQMAINVENPRRTSLYNIYYDVLIDNHVSGCISQRKNAVLKRAFKVTDSKTKQEKEEITELLECSWFKNFMSLALDSIYWGHSLIELGDVTEIRGKKQYTGATLVPREHVIPEYGVILRDPNDDVKKGIDYRTLMGDYCLEVGDPYSLGLLLNVAPNAISKKNMAAFWDTFGELFGIPIRIAETTTKDPIELGKIDNMLKTMGAAAHGTFPEGTKIRVEDSKQSDSFNVFDKRIERINKEVSKAILNQTMTIEDGASLSQSQVHLDIFNRLCDSDADMLRDVVNNRLFPVMQRQGFPITDNLIFQWDDSVEFTPQECINIEQALLNSYEIDPEYFIEKYNIPITGKKEVSAFGLRAHGGNSFFD